MEEILVDSQHRTITIFGSSKPTHVDPEYGLAYETGKLFAQHGYTVCNGGYGGVMEASARGAKEAMGKTIGVITEQFSTTANIYIDQTICMKTLIERLMKLIELGDAYVVLKGSTGTLLELAAVWEFCNKGLMKVRPIVLIGEFWLPTVDTLRNSLVHEGSESAARYVDIAHSPKECVRIINERLQ